MQLGVLLDLILLLDVQSCPFIGLRLVRQWCPFLKRRGRHGYPCCGYVYAQLL